MRSSGSEEDTGPHDQEGDSEAGEDGCENSAHKFLGEASLILGLVHKVTIRELSPFRILKLERYATKVSNWKG